PLGRRQLNASNWPLGDHAGSITYPMSGKSTFVWLVPSIFITYSCGIPPRSLTNATCCPVFGFQDGEVFAPFEYVRRLGRAPEASVVNNSGLPYMLDINMICDPSGDQAG